MGKSLYSTFRVGGHMAALGLAFGDWWRHAATPTAVHGTRELQTQGAQSRVSPVSQFSRYRRLRRGEHDLLV